MKIVCVADVEREERGGERKREKDIRYIERERKKVKGRLRERERGREID